MLMKLLNLCYKFSSKCHIDFFSCVHKNKVEGQTSENPPECAVVNQTDNYGKEV